MRKIFHVPVLAFLAVVIFQAQTIRSEEVQFSNKRTITVSGVAERAMPADEVEVIGEVRVEGKELPATQERSQEQFLEIRNKLLALGIKAENIELTNHRIGKLYHHEERKRIHSGFYSERAFKILLKDAGLLEIVSQELAESPDVEISRTDFSRSDEIEIRKSLRTKALEAAKEKAEAMAAVYEEKLGKVLKMDENVSSGYFSPNNIRNTFANDIGGMAGSSANGRVTLSAQVKVTFALLD